MKRFIRNRRGYLGSGEMDGLERCKHGTSIYFSKRISICEFRSLEDSKLPGCFELILEEKLERVKGDLIPSYLREEIIQYLGGKCKLCGSTNILEIDHILPRAIKNKHAIENLQILCESCHAGKTVDDRSKITRHRQILNERTEKI